MDERVAGIFGGICQCQPSRRPDRSHFLSEPPMNATTKRVVMIVWVLSSLLVAMAPSDAQTTRSGADIAVVVHPDTPVSDLSLSDVRKVLLGERQYWSSKLPVVLLIRAPVARERDV